MKHTHPFRRAAHRRAFPDPYNLTTPNQTSHPGWRTALVAAVLAFVFFFVGAHSASAQATAQVSGTVADSTGAVVPGAAVKITNTDTAAVRTTQSNAEGAFSFPQLAIGPYRLEVTKEGFQTFAQSGIVLQVNTNPTIAVALQVGNVSQTVEVQSNAAMVETQNNSVGAVIEPEQVVDLPLNNRQPTDLIALAGGAVSGGSASSLDYPSAVSFSVAGSQTNSTNYLLDGAANMDYRSNIGSPMPFPDALQEFKIETSTIPANSGSRPGGVVSAITKSGTNSFHGDVFEFLRNGIMDAASYTIPNINGTLPPPVYDNLKRNQFGGVLGGPIKKDKVFFFYGFQETTNRQTSPSTHTVPTDAMRAGDFTTYLSPTCQSSQQYLNDNITFQGVAQPLVTAHDSNIILPAWLATPSAKVTAKITALYGHPDGYGTPQGENPCGTQTDTGYVHSNEYEHVIRGDWQKSSSNSIFARYFITNYNLLSSLTQPGNIFSTNGIGEADRVQNIALGDTYVFNPRIISSFRVDFNRTSTQRLGNNAVPNLCSLGVIGNCPTPHILQALSVSPGNQGWDYENAFGITENIGWQLGQHQLQFGFQGERIEMNGNGTFQLNPLPTFTSSGGYTNNNLADFVTGNPDSFGQGNGQLSRDYQYMPSLYIQDNWRMTRTFQVNLGLRWDPFFPQHNKYGEAADFNLDNYNNNIVSKQFVNAPPGVIFPGDAGFNDHSDSLSHALDFSPRVGFIWDPKGNGKETLRGGYGIYFDTSQMWNAMHVVLNPPWGNTVSFTPAPVNLSSTDPLQGGGEANPYFGQIDPFPTPFNPPSNWPFNANGGYVFQNQTIKPSDSQQWNVSYQRQIGANWLFAANYLGSKTTHMWLGNNINPNVVITAGMTAPGIVANNVVAGNPLSGSCTLLYQGQQYTFNPCNQTNTGKTATVNGVNDEAARRALNLSNPAQGYKVSGGISEAFSVGNSAYNGLLVSVQHRLSNGFSINGNYTWSHCLDDGEIGQDIVPAFQDPNNRKADWGNCSFDRRGIFNLSLVGQTPKFSNNWTERLAGNWSASGIFTASTGSYSSVTDGTDVSLIGQSGVPGSASYNDRPNQLGDPFIASGTGKCAAPVRTLANWFNACAYAKQPGGTFGDTARESLLGPSHWNFDTAVWRTFPIGEKFKLNLRGEGFNVFNHPQFGNPGTSLSSTSSLGRISSASAMRILQVAAKITF